MIYFHESLFYNHPDTASQSLLLCSCNHDFFFQGFCRIGICSIVYKLVYESTVDDSWFVNERVVNWDGNISMKSVNEKGELEHSGRARTLIDPSAFAPTRLSPRIRNPLPSNPTEVTCHFSHSVFLTIVVTETQVCTSPRSSIFNNWQPQNPKQARKGVQRWCWFLPVGNILAWKMNVQRISPCNPTP